MDKGTYPDVAENRNMLLPIMTGSRPVLSNNVLKKL